MDWRTNDIIIEEAFCDLMIKLKRAPTYAEVARKIGSMDEKTIERHLKEIPFDERFKIFRAGTPKVIANLFKQAISTDKEGIIKLWLEKVEGLESKEHQQVVKIKVTTTKSGN